MLTILTLFRNACAHNEIVYDYKTMWKLSQKDILHIYEKLGIEKNKKTGNYVHGTNDVLAVIISFSFMLDNSYFKQFIDQLKSLLKKLKNQIDENIYNDILQTMGLVFDLDKLRELKSNK